LKPAELTSQAAAGSYYYNADIIFTKLNDRRIPTSNGRCYFCGWRWYWHN